METADKTQGTEQHTMTADEQDDAELIRDYLRGDEESFRILYERHKRVLYAYLNRLCAGTAVPADDVFQQTWVRAIEKLDKYRHEEKFSAWLIRLAHNLTIDAFRQRKRQAEDVFDDPMEDVLPAGAGSAPWYDLDRSELSGMLEKALAKLSPELREVFLLRQEDLTFREIAEIQACPIGTCLARMRYALNNLQHTLNDWITEGV